MIPVWIVIALFAAFMQTLRTALQKHLTNSLSSMSVTWVRFSFGLPFALLYLGILHYWGNVIPEVNSRFIFFCIATSICQIAGTYMLVQLFAQRNFTIAITYSKTEALMTALLGVVLFGEYLSLIGILAIVMGVIGVVVISLVTTHLSLNNLINSITHKAALLGLGAGATYALGALCVRQASLSLEGGGFLMNAAFTLVLTLVFQTITLAIWIYIRQRSEFFYIRQQWPSLILVGLTSMVGSAGWFTAFTLVEAAYVKTVGQVEIILSLFFTRHLFKETMSKLEIAGMLFVIFSIVMLLWI